MEFFKKLNHSKSFIILNIFILFLFTNALLSNFYWRKDLSQNNRFDITDSTELVLKNLPTKLYIDAYFSTDIPGEYKARMNITKEMLKEIASVNRSKVELRFFDPDTNENDKKKANEFGIEPQTIQKVERGSAEVKQAYFGVTLTLGTKIETLPVVFYPEQVEYQVLSTLKKMTKKNTASEIGWVKTKGAFTTPTPMMNTISKDTMGIYVKHFLKVKKGIL